jgi:catechol 2,3-dioxygenase-like lactoylglutathione lyase family enzyme
MDLITTGNERLQTDQASTIAHGLLQIDGMNMTSICTHDLEASMEFYHTLLGFEKVKPLGRGYILKHPSFDLIVFLEGGYNKVDIYLNPARVSFNFHCAVGVLKAIQILKEKQVPLFGQFTNREQNFANVQFEDPSGNLIEISGRP